MNNEPDFIVDPSGDVRDVRSQKSFQTPPSAASQPSRDETFRPNSTPQWPQAYTEAKPNNSDILIPIGLIITLGIFLIRLIIGLSQSRTTTSFTGVSEGSSGRASYSGLAASSVKSGLEYYRKGDYESAIREFTTAIKADPHMPEAFNDRGIAYDSLGEPDNAMADLNHAIQIAPDYATPYNNRGGLYFSQDKLGLALADFDKAIELNPRLGKAFYNRGLYYLALNDYTQAIADLSTAIDLAPEYLSSVYATLESKGVTENNLLKSSPFYATLESRGVTENDLLNSSPFSLGFGDDLGNAQITDSLAEAYQLRGLAYRQTGDELKAQADLAKAAALGLPEEQALMLAMFFLQPTIEWNTDPQETFTTPLATPPETFPEIFSSEMLIRLGPEGGNVSALAIDPFQPGTLYAGTAGGVYKSIDNGENWRLVNTGLPASYVTALAIDPAMPNTVYAGTTLGLYKSTDGGELWNVGIQSGSDGDPMVVTALIVDPAHPTTLYAGTATGMFKSIDGGLTWHAGISSANFLNIETVVIDPSNPATLYAGEYRGVFKSTDGGETWNEASPGSITGPIHALAVDPLTPSILYAGTNRGVYKSTNGGENWTPLSAELNDTSVQVLAIDPVEPTKLYLGIFGGGVIIIYQMESRDR